MKLNLAVQARTLGKKSEKKTLRKSGNIPAIIYSDGQPGITISVQSNEFTKLYKKSLATVTVFGLNLDGKEILAIVKARQIHPVSRDFIHVDFMELHKEKEINLSVPIKIVGSPHALKEGGVMDVLLRELKISCFPQYIPEDIPINVEELKIGETFYVKDLKLKNMTIKDSPSQAIVSVSLPKSE